MRSVAFAALIGSAAAFSPSMSLDVSRRQVVQTGAAAAAVAPFLQQVPAQAAMDKSGRAPVITIFDHRGCTAHANKEYTGAKANSQDDEMCVKVASAKIAVSEGDAARKLQEFISYQAKGIDGPYTGKGKK
ncbi:phycoerythrin alpha subunit 19 [Guillardia theta CCMP2712]|uniref:Phycoerythrin alpha subunit 19 n=1 Tax=Guillardia theta (strain CCMP2712) TaxID=905079 RepID=L1IIS5_GUITC|nr:phycoerythrin alpha subunit 19 [Guillardia theta CCMP2712]EKX36002.1 phycoerythrin alpha subunit 19 [Guillardia theta CCMP2712]|eukprot:XP_005822982.1 phycoerythrin alpha subunit 19 [Guillardia theta CCMP2712]